MVVALRALKRRAQPDRPSRIHPVKDLVDPTLLWIGACLNIGRSTAMKPGGNSGRLIGLRQEISRQLLDGELVERQIGIQGSDHPVAIGPEAAEVIPLITMRVSVAGQIEPHAGPTNPELVATEQPVDQPLVSIGIWLGKECCPLLQTRRQPCQVKGNPPQQLFPFSWRRK